MHVFDHPDMSPEQDKSQGLSPAVLQCLCKQQGEHGQRQDQSMSSVQSGCGNQGKNGTEKILIFFSSVFL